MASRTYSFREFRFDPARRELWHRGQRILLQPKVFDCLAYLIENRHRAVGRDEMIAAVWGKVDVTDNVLGQIIGRVRHAVGDTGEDQRLVRTLPRFGYSWLAPVEVVEADSPAVECEPAIDATPDVCDPIAMPEPTERTPAKTTHAFMHRRFAIAAAIVLLAAAAGATLIVARMHAMRDAPIGARTERGAALVLPVTVSADDSYAWVRLGVMDLIGARLRAAGEPVVPSDNVVAIAKHLEGRATDDTAEIESLGRDANAALVIDARATNSEGRWHVALRTLRGHDPPLLAESDSSDVIEAATTAADRMALMLGLPPVRAGNDGGEQALAALMQRAEAAILSGQLDAARAIFNSLDEQQRSRPDILFQLGRIDVYGGRLDEAKSEFDRMLAAASDRDDPVSRGRALTGLAEISIRRDDADDAAHKADDAVALLANTNAHRELGQALLARAVARTSQRRFDDALADFARARVALESAGDRLGIARLDVGVGELESGRDHFVEAIPGLSTAAERLAMFNDVSGEVSAYTSLAYAQLASVDATGSLATDAHLRELLATAPDPRSNRFIEVLRVRILAANGRLAESDALLRKLHAEAVETNDALLLAGLPSIAARHALRSGDAAEAERQASAALHADWDAVDPREYARTWLTLVRAQIAEGRVNQASASVADGAGWAKKNGTAAAGIYTALAAAEEAASRKDTVGAEAAYDAAYRQADAGRVPLDVLEVAQSYAAFLIRQGDLARAGPIVARVAAWAPQNYDAALLQLRFYHALGSPLAWRAALDRVRALAAERSVPGDLLIEPGDSPRRINGP